MHQEIWAHKTCDNMSVLKTGLAMIEGIYGRDGNGFGIGNDHLTNLVMFSKDKFRLDLIGLYLGGPRAREHSPVPHRKGTRSLRHVQSVGCADLRMGRWRSRAAQIDRLPANAAKDLLSCRRLASRSITWSTSHSITTATKYDQPTGIRRHPRCGSCGPRAEPRPLRPVD